MKRKLNEEDVPTPVDDAAKVTAPAKSNAISSFESFNLDSRLLQAIAKVKYGKPTPVQAQGIPLALEGKDIVARARTGTGKTAVYVLPIIHAILQQKISKPREKGVRALLLVPTKELAQQVSKVVSDFCAFCAKDIKSLNLTQKVSDAVQRSLLAETPEVVVATPARAWINVASGALTLEKVTHVVIDEADLVLSYDHGEDLGNIARSMPHGVQSFLMSATLSEEVDGLKAGFCKDPAVLALDDDESEKEKLKQRVVMCGEEDKFLFLYVLVKLKLLQGKTIIFVEDIDRCYRLKLYLEQFGVRSCVLNSELPVNSRIHVVDEFNKGVYDIIIASDEHEVTGSGSQQTPRKDDTKENEDGDQKPPPRKKHKSANKDKEYGISRGIDFKNVACVLNFDLPTSSKSYTHRIGRTARAGKSGTAMSFAVPRSLYRKHKHISVRSARHDEETLASIHKHQAKKGAEVEEYPFDMSKVEGFRYRCTDALRAVTTIAIREARTRELRNELIKSEKLKRHFEENPDDLKHLRHDGESHTVRIQPHLKHVPDYLMPNGGGKDVGGELGFVGMGKTGPENRLRRIRRINRAKGRGKIQKSKKSDPLKTFNARGRGKK